MRADKEKKTKKGKKNAERCGHWRRSKTLAACVEVYTAACPINRETHLFFNLLPCLVFDDKTVKHERESC